jgi:hypothetical protein
MTNPNKTERLKPKMKEAVLLLAASIGPSDVSKKLNVSRTVDLLNQLESLNE